MKKVILIAGIVLIALLAALLSIPVIFKDALLEKTKSTINQNLNVNVDFDGFSLSLISGFPRASLSMKNVLVTGKGPFRGDTLLAIKSVSTKFGLFDLFSPGNITINELILVQPRMKLRVNSDNLSNWDILPETGDQEPETVKKEETAAFGMQLSKIKVEQGLLTYSDVTLPLEIVFRDLNLGISGRMYGSDTRLKIEGASEESGLVYDSVSWISKTRLEIRSILDINFDTWNFSFDKSELMVNGLPLNVEGSFSMPGDSILFDMKFISATSGLDGFLKLVPAGYRHLLKDIDAEGNATVTGLLKGVYFDEIYPAFSVKANLSDGRIRYAGLPEEISHIAADISLEKPEGSMDLLTVNLLNAHIMIRNNPVDFSLKLGNLFKDISFDGRIKGKVNFDQLKGAIPMDSLLMSGTMDLNIGANGTMSAIENKNYNLIKTGGIVALDGFSFITSQLTHPVLVSSGKLDFSPEKVNLSQLDVKIGESDMALSGAVTGYYPYLFSNGILSGNVTLTSGYMNLNELMSVYKTPGSSHKEIQKPVNTTGPSTTDSLSATPVAFSVPKNLNLALNTQIKKAYYERLTLTNIAGQVTAMNGKLDLSGLNMNLLNGELKLTGSYEKPDQRNPMVDMTLNLLSVDIPAAFQSLKLVRNYIPVSAQSKGQFSTTLTLTSGLDNRMNLDLKTLNGTGIFSSSNVKVLNSPVFSQLKSILKEEKLRNVQIDDFSASFTFENGDLLLKPFTTRISGQEATFAGRLSKDNLIDMDIRFVIQRDALSENLSNTIGIIPGQKNLDAIPVGVKLKGIIKDPDVKIDISEAKKMITDGIRNASKEEIKNTINKVGEGLKKLFK